MHRAFGNIYGCADRDFGPGPVFEKLCPAFDHVKTLVFV
jgi:hypothetical protein